MNKKVDTRIDYLDALRGVAVISVVAFHISGYFHNISTQNTLLKTFDWLLSGVVDWGRFGVVLFFLISGFIISNSLNKSPDLSKFGLSRFFRLFPAYWLSLGILILLSVFFGTGEYPLEQIAANATMVPKVFHQKEMSGVFWTLFIELLFYFTIAIFFRLNLHNNAIVIGTSAVVLHLIAPIAILINHFLLLKIPVLYVFYHLSFLYAGNLLRIAIFEKRRSATYLSILFVFLVIFSTQLLSGVFSYQPNAYGFCNVNAASNLSCLFPCSNNFCNNN